MKRVYDAVVEEHLSQYEQMVFLSGPRQVGKTTTARRFLDKSQHSNYLNWDSVKDREKILSGYDFVTEGLHLDILQASKPIVILDEVHKYKDWKNYLKGLIDEYKGRINIIVTGSSKLNIFRRGGDSLMGRYFPYRVHPLSVGELVRQQFTSELLSTPQFLEDIQFDALFRFGGFPEPFLKRDVRFHRRWQNLRQEQLLKEDVRTLEKVQDLAQLELLAFLLQHQTGQLLNYTNFANKVRVSDKTIRRWIKIMGSLFYCFTLSPWSKNVARSLLKEPKVYLWDWSIIEDEGARIENFVASHLYKAIHFWTDVGFGKFDLYFLRDKDKREVDFLITKNLKPWVMIEVKKSQNEPLSSSLKHFQKQLNADIVLQLAFDLPYMDYDCRKLNEPKIFPMRTFLSQLV